MIVILPTDALRLAALLSDAWPVPMIFGVHAVKKIEKRANPRRRIFFCDPEEGIYADRKD